MEMPPEATQWPGVCVDPLVGIQGGPGACEADSRKRVTIDERINQSERARAHIAPRARSRFECQSGSLPGQTIEEADQVYFRHPELPIAMLASIRTQRLECVVVGLPFP